MLAREQPPAPSDGKRLASAEPNFDPKVKWWLADLLRIAGVTSVGAAVTIVAKGGF